MSPNGQLVLLNPDRRSTAAHQRSSQLGLRPAFDVDEPPRRPTTDAVAQGGFSQEASNIRIEHTEALLSNNNLEE